jgi:hypothetical protein
MAKLPKMFTTDIKKSPVKQQEKSKDLNSLDLLLRLADVAEDKLFDFSIKGQNRNTPKEEQFVLNTIQKLKEDQGAVLGIDIYKYSQFPPDKQKLIPSLFFLLKYFTDNSFCYSESLLSYHYDVDDLKKDFVHTGDGGYLFFKHPLEAVMYLLHFSFTVHLFNSHHLFSALRNFMGEPLTLRYAITFDNLYKIDSKFFGPAIIHNARILSKDKLNRVLIDDNTYDWFLANTNGIENLPNITRDDINHLEIAQTTKPLKSVYFDPTKKSKIKSVFCQKLEKISVKDDHFDIYNIMIQFCGAKSNRFDPAKKLSIITTVGNMNCNGI